MKAGLLITLVLATGCGTATASSTTAATPTTAATTVPAGQCFSVTCATLPSLDHSVFELMWANNEATVCADVRNLLALGHPLDDVVETGVAEWVHLDPAASAETLGLLSDALRDCVR